MNGSDEKAVVLFVTRKWPPAVGGMEQYSFALTRELDRLTRLTIRALPGREDGRPPSVTRLIGFACATVWYLLRRAPRFDVLHFGDLALWPLATVGRLRNRDAVCVVSAHGTDIAYPLRQGVLPRLYGLYLAIGARLNPTLRVLANSRATAELCTRAGFAVHATIPLAVTPAEAPRPLPAPSPYVLFVGRLIRRKGCGWFIANVLPELDAELRLVVAGTQWDRAETEALDNERVSYLGAVFGSELARLRREATAVVMPNISCEGRDFEGFGLTAVETAADQGVLLAAAVDGVVDAVIDGITGFLMPAGEPAAWIRRIHEIRGWTPASRESFVREACSRARQEFTWQRVARQTLNAYRHDVAEIPGVAE